MMLEAGDEVLTRIEESSRRLGRSTRFESVNIVHFLTESHRSLNHANR